MNDRRPEPTIDAAFDLRIRERASAAPTGPTRVRARRSAATLRSATDAPARLRDVQTWISDAVTRPLEDGDTHDAERVVTAGPRLSAADRLDLYRWGYHARLVECLADDYPAVRHAIGEDAFEALCHGYAAAYPSRSPSLNYFGRSMPAHIQASGGAHAHFLEGLARLEWSLVEMIHAPSAPVLALDELQTLGESEWADARLPASETVRVLVFDHPVNRYFQAFRDGDAPTIPAARPSATAVYRRGYTVWRMDLTPAMKGLLESLFAGATLGEALGAIAAHAEDADALAEAERNVMVWFREWVAGGFFARVELR